MNNRIRRPGAWRRWPSPAMIVALIALFVALSGGAAAGTFLATKGPSVHAVSRLQASAAARLVKKANIAPE